MLFRSDLFHNWLGKIPADVVGKFDIVFWKVYSGQFVSDQLSVGAADVDLEFLTYVDECYNNRSADVSVELRGRISARSSDDWLSDGIGQAVYGHNGETV